MKKRIVFAQSRQQMVYLMITLIYRLSYLAAFMGVIALSFLILMTVASVAGNSLSAVGLGPVPGEYELVEVMTAIAIFLFLPWTDLTNSHATVGIFYEHFPPWMQKAVQFIGDILMIALWLMLTWKLFDGLLEKYVAEETTFILRIPLWFIYSICFSGAVIGCFAYIAKALIHLGIAKRPESIAATTAGVH